MRSAILLAAVAGLATAAPVAEPQHIQFDDYDTAPVIKETGPPINKVSDPIDYSPAKAAAAAAKDAESDPVAARRRKVKRGANDPCGQQPGGHGPSVSPDTDQAFLQSSDLSNIAENAPVPQGYTQSFSKLHGSVEGNGYMGYYLLESYDTIKCQQYCDAATSCYGFNVFIERNPSLNPADSCPNPPSLSNFKCTLWGYAVNEASATNVGQWRNDFHVVITGSNGYVKNSPPPSYANFTGPTQLGGAINAPVGSFIGSKYYPGPYDPGQCAAACLETTQFDREHLVDASGHYDACNFFNSYVLSKNNVPEGTYCGMYKAPWDKQYSTNVGERRGDDYYSVSQSYGYALDPQDDQTI